MVANCSTRLGTPFHVKSFKEVEIAQAEAETSHPRALRAQCPRGGRDDRSGSQRQLRSIPVLKIGALKIVPRGPWLKQIGADDAA
jgi:hypothetical protein